jgi:peroxin-19
MAELGAAAGEGGGGGAPPPTSPAAATLAALAGAAPASSTSAAAAAEGEAEGPATPADLDPLLARLEATLASLSAGAPAGDGGCGGDGGGGDDSGGGGADTAGGAPSPASAAAGLMADSVMRALLARDVLHAPLAEIGSRYPAWLDAAKMEGTLSEADEARYVAQLGCVRRIVGLYEAEAREEAAAAAAEGGGGGGGGAATDRFPALFALLQEMQGHGQPPQAIVDELAPGLAFDEDGLPVMPAGGGGGGGGGGGLLGGLLLPGGGGAGGAGGACCLM